MKERNDLCRTSYTVIGAQARESLFSKKLSKRPREIVIVFRITFVFPVQDHLYLRFISDRGSGLGIYWFGKPSL